MTINFAVVETYIFIPRASVTPEVLGNIHLKLVAKMEAMGDEGIPAPFADLEQALNFFGMDAFFDDEGNLSEIDFIGGHPLQMLLLEELAAIMRPESWMTMLDGDQPFQWYFDNKKVYTRACKVLGLITLEEDQDRQKLGLEPKFGLRDCIVEECTNVTVGPPGAKCAGCQGETHEGR